MNIAWISKFPSKFSGVCPGIDTAGVAAVQKSGIGGAVVAATPGVEFDDAGVAATSKLKLVPSSSSLVKGLELESSLSNCFSIF